MSKLRLEKEKILSTRIITKHKAAGIEDTDPDSNSEKRSKVFSKIWLNCYLNRNIKPSLIVADLSVVE